MDGNRENQPMQQNPYVQPAQDWSAYQYSQPANNPMFATGVPTDGSKKKKGGIGKIIALIVVMVVLLLGVGGFCLYQFVFNIPEARLAKGLAIFAQEMATYGAGGASETGIEELVQNMQEDNASTIDIRMNVTLPEVDTIGVDYLQKFDGENQLMQAEFALSFFNIKLLEAGMAADAEKLYVSVPDIADEWYYLNTQTLGADYQSSMWKEVLGMEVAEDYSFSLFEEEAEADVAVSDEGTVVLQEEWLALIEEYTPRFAEGATIEDSGNVVEIERDGKTVRCEGVRVIIEKEVLNDFLKDFFELYEEYYEEDIAFEGELKSDVELCFYMDSKNRIVNISTPEKIKFADSDVESIGFSLVFSGEEHALDEISGNGKMEIFDETLTFEVERNAETKGSVLEDEWKLLMDGESGGEVSMEWTYAIDWEDLECESNLTVESDSAKLENILVGACSDIDSGESMTVEIEEFSILENGKEMVKISGSIEVGVLEEEIAMPSEATDLMGMNEEELINIIMNATDYIMKYEDYLNY